jgi:serine/threonine protein kinase
LSSSAEVFGQYEVLECLGKGGMATVHKARRRGIEGFERIDALKRLLPHLEADPVFVDSFVAEAKLAAQLQHGNIVQIHELGRHEGRYFIAMEYLAGHTLQEVLKQAGRVAGPPPIAACACLLGELCDALDYAHSRTDHGSGEPLGLVHADVSPSNAIVNPAGSLKMIDFGIARATSPGQRQRGVFVAGKIGYMAPEVMRAQGIDARADIFGAGVIAWELLTARQLFSPRQAAVVTARLADEIEPPSVHNPSCPRELDQIVLTAIAADPNERWASAAAMREALDRAMHALGVPATRREVGRWLDHAFSLDARHGRAPLAAGSKRRITLPLPALPDVQDAIIPPDAPILLPDLPIGDVDGDDEETGDHWSSVVEAEHIPVLVTESIETCDAVAEARGTGVQDVPIEGAPPSPRKRAPTVSSPPVEPELMPKITFRAPTHDSED